MKRATPYPDSFLALMARVDVPMSHLAPKHPASVGVSLASDSVDAMKGLAKAYGVMAPDILRAAFVIGIETLIFEAEAMHGPQKTA